MNTTSLTTLLMKSAIMVAVFTATPFATAEANEEEQKLIAILESDSPEAKKALACKSLAVHGSQDAVPALAKLLPNERLSSWARIPLEVIPGSEADEALRSAVQQLSGRQLIGVINSVGVRRDAGSIETVAKHLSSDDELVVSAAAVAIGRIGNEAAANVLKAALTEGSEIVRAAAADGGVRCAEQLHADGKSSNATQLYDQIRAADVPKQRVLEATRGAILSRGVDGIPLLLEQLKADDRELYEIGLSTAREVEGSEATEALVAHLLETNSRRRADLLLVLADRGDRRALPAVLQTAFDGPAVARLASIRVLQRLGDASCVETLLTIATESDEEVADVAKTALEKLDDAKVDADLVDRLSSAKGKDLQTVIEVIGKRRIDAYAHLRKAADATNGEIRRAALHALGATVDLDKLSFLIQRAASPTHPEDAETVGKALRAAAVRMHEQDACATKLSDALPKSPAATQQTILKILGEMGGAKALQTLGATAREGSPALQDTATRLLGEWMSVDAETELMRLAKNRGRYQVRALRGYIRLARQFPMPNDQRVAMCRKALEAATRDDERKLVLGILERYANLETLKVAAEVVALPSMKKDATATCKAIAKKIGNDSPEVKAILSRAGVR